MINKKIVSAAAANAIDKLSIRLSIIFGGLLDFTLAAVAVTERQRPQDTAYGLEPRSVHVYINIVLHYATQGSHIVRYLDV